MFFLLTNKWKFLTNLWIKQNLLVKHWEVTNPITEMLVTMNGEYWSLVTDEPVEFEK